MSQATAVYCTICDTEDCRAVHQPEEFGVMGPAVAEEKESLSLSAVAAHLHTPPKLAYERDILGVFVRNLRLCGVVGEERNAKLVYLCLTSRLLPEPVSAAIKGVSSSGKSHTADSTLKFFPESAYIEMTAMSEKALIYMKEEFSHKTIVLFEATALQEQKEKEGHSTAYFVRSLLSEGRIKYPVTVRDKEGGWTVKTIVKEGPTNLIVTTTATNLHGENETRLISMPTNDSNEQTARILMQLASGRPESVDFRPWHELQLWLEGAEHRVVIPYASYLAENVPPVAVRLRRDFRAILQLIRTHAIVHQVTRETDAQGRIIATEADYLAVRGLVSDLISDGVGATVPNTIRETVETVRSLGALSDEGVTVHAVAAKLDLDRSAAQRRLQSARERGYIVNKEERRGRPARYELAEALPDEVELLPPTCTPTKHESAGQQGVCSSAVVTERESPPIELVAPSNGSKPAAPAHTRPCSGCGSPTFAEDTLCLTCRDDWGTAS